MRSIRISPYLAGIRDDTHVDVEGKHDPDNSLTCSPELQVVFALKSLQVIVFQLNRVSTLK